MIGFLCLFCTAATTWYDQKMEGWYYFEEHSSESSLEPQEAREILETAKRQLQDLLALALLAPTGENVSNYLSCQNFWSHQSSYFAQACGTIEEQWSLQKAGQKYFLLFCFHGADPQANGAAQTAKEFSEKHRWILKTVSLDGQGLSSLQDVEEDRGIAKRLNIEHSPSFYLIDPATKKARLTGIGTLSLIELEESVALQLGGLHEVL